MKILLAIAAVGEIVAGLIALVNPPLAVRWLLGVEITGAGIVVSRIAGIALIALGVACWPRASGSGASSGMLTYSALATGYLAYLGISGEWHGELLWPAVVAHATMTLLLAWRTVGRK
jgi:hypothetical protein